MSKLTRGLVLGAMLAVLSSATAAVAQQQPLSMNEAVSQFRAGERASMGQPVSRDQAVQQFRAGERASTGQPVSRTTPSSSSGRASGPRSSSPRTRPPSRRWRSSAGRTTSRPARSPLPPSRPRTASPTPRSPCSSHSAPPPPWPSALTPCPSAARPARRPTRHLTTHPRPDGAAAPTRQPHRSSVPRLTTNGRFGSSRRIAEGGGYVLAQRAVPACRPRAAQVPGAGSRWQPLGGRRPEPQGGARAEQSAGPPRPAGPEHMLELQQVAVMLTEVARRMCPPGPAGGC